MSEVKRRTKSKYFEQEIWNNVLKQNSFECRRLNLKYHKLEKDESITVKSWNQEQLLMLRKNKKLRDLMAGSAGSTEHFTQRSNELSPSKYLSLPPLTTAQRPHSTASCTQGTTSSGLLTGSTERPRPRSHTDVTSISTNCLSPKKHSRQEEVCLPAVSPSQIRRSSHSACSGSTSLSHSEITKQRKTSWTRPSTQLHRRDNNTP